MKFDFDRNEDSVFRCSRTVVAQALGQLLIEHLDTTAQMVKELAAVHTLKIVKDILDALDDQTLDDFACIDNIVDILGEYGMYTSRHDW